MDCLEVILLTDDLQKECIVLTMGDILREVNKQKKPKEA